VKQPSPATRHRIALTDLFSDEQGRVQCYASLNPGRVQAEPVPGHSRVILPQRVKCSGGLQAAHWISKQTLKLERSKVNVSRHRFTDDPRLALLDVTEDDLVADARNGIPLCFEHHNAFDGKRSYRLDLYPPPTVLEFATQYGLSHLIEDHPAEPDPYAQTGLLGGLLIEDEEAA
jgi:hypothetical protein